MKKEKGKLRTITDPQSQGYVEDRRPTREQHLELVPPGVRRLQGLALTVKGESKEQSNTQ